MIALPPGVRYETTGLPHLVIDRPACRATLYLHGATLTSFVPRGQEDEIGRAHV